MSDKTATPILRRRGSQPDRDSCSAEHPCAVPSEIREALLRYPVGDAKAEERLKEAAGCEGGLKGLTPSQEEELRAREKAATTREMDIVALKEAHAVRESKVAAREGEALIHEEKLEEDASKQRTVRGHLKKLKSEVATAKESHDDYLAKTNVKIDMREKRPTEAANGRVK